MADDATELTADCSRCAALCCVALPFSRSADFAFDKAAGAPCRHLDERFRCGVHDSLRARGLPGCAVYDCHGAGQKVTQQVFAGRTWRDDRETARAMFAVFHVVRRLHELLRRLADALALPVAAPLRAELRAAYDDIDGRTRGDADAIARVDPDAERERVAVLLRRVSEAVRATAPGPRADHRGAALVGARLARADLRAADLRGALLVGATLRGADLRLADVLGADTRGADVRGADLSTSLFLAQEQLDAARGDAATRVPAHLRRPAHWA